MKLNYRDKLSSERSRDRGKTLGVGSVVVLAVFIFLASGPLMISSIFPELFLIFVALGALLLPIAGVMALRCLRIPEGDGKRWAMTSVVLITFILVGLLGYISLLL